MTHKKIINKKEVDLITHHRRCFSKTSVFSVLFCVDVDYQVEVLDCLKDLKNTWLINIV